MLELPEGLPTARRPLARRAARRPRQSRHRRPSRTTTPDRLCAQLERLYPERTIDASDLREVIKPVYRQMFELLSGRSAAGDASPRSATRRCSPTRPRVRASFPRSEILYAATPGIRERSGVAGAVPTFVLEAEAAGRPRRSGACSACGASRTRWNGIRTRASARSTRTSSPRCAQGSTALLPPLLARIRAERTNTADVRVLREFVERVEPVESLTLSCALDGEPVAGLAERPYFVQVGKGAGSLQAFVVWDAAAGWPPTPEAAQGLAMALADALGINLVETFLAFIQSDADQRRSLLDIAGGAGLLAEIEDELTDVTASAAREDEASGAGANRRPRRSRHREAGRSRLRSRACSAAGTASALRGPHDRRRADARRRRRPRERRRPSNGGNATAHRRAHRPPPNAPRPGRT